MLAYSIRHAHFWPEAVLNGFHIQMTRHYHLNKGGQTHFIQTGAKIC
jgi:hypothetical protein